MSETTQGPVEVDEIRTKRPIHSLRAAYATERYTVLTGQRPVGFGGPRLDRDVDREARLAVSAELGQHRTDVTAAYIGGAR